MTREELIAHCRYYKGEKECPIKKEKDNKHLIWFYESKWVEFTLADNNFADYCIEMYKEAGLSTFREKGPEPLSLKAYLFGRYCHWNEGTLKELAPCFKRWFNQYYLS